MSTTMELTAPRFPINVKRRAVSAVRDFPKGCGPKVISNPNPNPIPTSTPTPSPAEFDSKSETSSSLKVPDEGPRVSNMDCLENRDESDMGSAQNAAKSEDLEIQNGSLDPVEINGHGHADEEQCGPKRLANGVMEVDRCVLETEVFGSKTFLSPKRRKVSAVRDFPAGCGRGALRIGTVTKSLGVGSVASSSESKAFDNDTEVGSSKSKAFHGKTDDESKDLVAGDSSERAEDEVRKSSEELIGEEVQETKGDDIVKSSKVAILSGEKEEELAKPVGSPAKKFDCEVTRNESKKIKIKIKDAIKEAAVKSPKMKGLDVETEATEGSAQVSSENEVKKNDSKKISQNVRESSSEGRVKPSGNTLEENKVKKLVIRSSSEKKLDGRDLKQPGKNLQGKEPQDAGDASGIKISHKAGKGLALVPGSRDGENMKRKLPNEERDESLEAYGDKLIVQALMSAENCPWRKNKSSGGIKSRSAPPRTRAKKKAPKLLGGNSASRFTDIVVLDDDEGLPPEDCGNEKALTIYNGSSELCVTMTPFVPSKFICTGNSSKEVVDRNMVKKTLRLFQLITRKLLQKEEKSKGMLSQGKEASSKENGSKRVDLAAGSILKDNNHWVNHGNPIIGNVPGVEVGDEFHYRVELSIIGIHRPFQGGIDSTKRNGVLLATSIVASGGYPDDIDSSESDVLIYSGSGGNATGTGDKQAGDQKLERGNLALKNSIDAQTPVRVVYGSKEFIYSDVRPKAVSTYTYDGLYLVEKYWPERGNNGFNVFKYRLRKIPGQPEISLKELKKSKKSKVREGIVVKDISVGKESMPICAVNTVDNELPIPFKYINKVIYPKGNVPKSPKGCDCTNGCSDSEKCACAMKNGGEIPYNFNGAIVQAKILVYECGPSCKCPPSCHNRVSQQGIKLPLETFKTKTRGWGVRSLYSIPSGTFVCEYVGEMLAEAEAEQRDNDEYLFDIGNNYDDHNLWDGLPSFVPGVASNASCENVEEGAFTIDAAKFGNIGRFINHSCSPNLYAQNVLYDHDEKKMPHVMFFAIDNIPPLQELTYHYNYTLDQVRDSEGNIKKKECFCGSHECTGRLY